MSLRGRVFAAVYEHALASSERAGLADRRRDVLSAARGRVLEVGPGPGMNLAHYPREGVEELVLAEPEEPMAERLERRLAKDGVAGRVVRAPAAALPFRDGSFDTVVSTATRRRRSSARRSPSSASTAVACRRPRRS